MTVGTDHEDVYCKNVYFSNLSDCQFGDIAVELHVHVIIVKYVSAFLFLSPSLLPSLPSGTNAEESQPSQHTAVHWHPLQGGQGASAHHRVC